MSNNNVLPTSASFLVSEDCNLRCTYCFEKHKENYMSIETARKGLEYLCTNAAKNGENSFHAMIFGGEPFTKPKIVEEILRYGLELSNKYNVKFSASVVTNATILTEDIENMIKKYRDIVNLSVQLSVDGIKSVHDKYRLTKSGKGSFNIIEKNIPRWKALFQDRMELLNIHGCSNHDTLPYLYENYIFFREAWGIPRIWFMPIHSENWQDEDVKVYEEQLTKIADYIIKRCKEENSNQEAINYAPIDKCFNGDAFSHAPCGAGKNFVTITANGEIYPCHQFYFNDAEKTTKMGDIWNGIDELRRKIFSDYDNSDMSCSKDNPNCECYGCYRCIAENWQQNGSILSNIRGIRCAMSHVERKIQLRIRKELKEMGLFGNSNNSINNNNTNTCDVVVQCEGNTRDLNANGCKCGDKNEVIKNDDVFAEALKYIIEKLDVIEKEQALILKKLL